jgi:hypothetical protein
MMELVVNALMIWLLQFSSADMVISTTDHAVPYAYTDDGTTLSYTDDGTTL